MTFIKGNTIRNTGRTRIKIGQRLSPKTEFKKGVSSWNKDKELSKEHIEKLKGKRPNASGAKNHNWKGGVSTENEKVRGSLEYKLWQDSVKNRDGNCCQKCGEMRVSKIMAHHILNFSNYKELRLAINNGITFCRKCHKEFHLKYGFKNNNQEQLIEFLNNK